MRADLKRERERDARLDRAKKAKTGGPTRDDADRDISETVALGKALPKSQDAMFDARLYNQSQGMSAGFGAEDDYAVYSKPFSAGSATTNLYKPTKAADGDAYGGGGGDADLGSLLDTGKFKADRGFAGAEAALVGNVGGRTKPVEFEKAASADSFGIESFLSEARSRSNALEKIGSQGHMSASAGSAGLDAGNGSSRSKVDFQPASSRR